MAAEQLQSIISADWAWRMSDSPEWATAVGIHESNDRLDDRSLESFAAREAHCRSVLEQLAQVPTEGLSEKDQTNHALLSHQCRTYAEGAAFRTFLMCINNLEGPQTELPQLVAYTRFASTADYEMFLQRLANVPAQLQQTQALLQQGLDEGLVMPKICVETVPGQLEAFAAAEPEACPLYKPFAGFPDEVAEADRERLAAAGAAALRDVVLPAFAAFHLFVRDTYLPGCRDSIACTDLPNGAARYASCINFHVTQPMEAQAIHETGLREVERILGEMREVMAQVGFEGTLQEFFQHLRQAPEFYYASEEELLQGYRDICAEIDQALPSLFGKLPQVACQIVPTPAHQAADAPAAYYLGPAGDGSRPGTFFANTHDLPARPKYEQQALALHECQPGHHTQTALSCEDTDLPDFRRFFDDRRYWEAPSRYPFETAYIEGWGLYSESLGKELGLYALPHDWFGRLSMEIFRAMRLVVDTGMHALGWTTERAIEYMDANSGLSRHNIEHEVTRYVCWPGQALAYKLGEIELQRLRREATEARGDRWDVRAFHDLLMRIGAAPMSVIEAQVRQQTEAILS